MLKIRLRCAGVIAALLLSITGAQAAPPPAAAFFKDADVTDVQLSPSGRQLAITTARGLQRVGLVVFDLGSGKLSRAAHFADADVTRVRWVNDGRLLFSIEDLSEGSGRPNGQPGLFAVNPDGSDMRQLIRRTGLTSAKDRFGKLDRVLDWNHRLLRVPAPRADVAVDEVLIAQISIDADRIATPLWINTRTGITRKAHANAPAHTTGWLTDSHGELRVAITEHAGRRAAPRTGAARASRTGGCCTRATCSTRPSACTPWTRPAGST